MSDHYLHELQRHLEVARPGWKRIGDELHGPGTLAVRVREHGRSADVAHLDVDFVLNRDRPDAPVISDCTTGVGRDEQSRAAWAVDTWARCTLPVVLELLLQTGEHATHFRDGEAGISGWHVIHGPITGWGRDNHAEDLADWIADHAVLPRLSDVLQPDLEGRPLSSIRLFFGGNGSEEVSEVQVNGVVPPHASQALAAIEWPRPPAVGYVRIFVLAVHSVSS